jgi:hypothetical protein
MREDIKPKACDEIEDLKQMLKECLSYLFFYEDTGPPGMGWQSQELLDLISRLESLIDEGKL